MFLTLIRSHSIAIGCWDFWVRLTSSKACYCLFLCYSTSTVMLPAAYYTQEVSLYEETHQHVCSDKRTNSHTAQHRASQSSKFSNQSESSSESNSGMLGSAQKVSSVQTSRRTNVRTPQELISKAAINLCSKCFLYQLLLLRYQW